jgi:hypothetical protein
MMTLGLHKGQMVTLPTHDRAQTHKSVVAIATMIDFVRWSLDRSLATFFKKSYKSKTVQAVRQMKDKQSNKLVRQTYLGCPLLCNKEK